MVTESRKVSLIFTGSVLRGISMAKIENTEAHKDTHVDRISRWRLAGEGWELWIWMEE